MPNPAVPYAKGPIWSAIDRFFSRSDLTKRFENKLNVLESLHRSERFTDFQRGSSTSGIDIDALKAHINRDWFGLEREGDGWRPRPLPREDSTTISSTGAWRGWAGNAEGIVRETVLRAIEISLGLRHIPWRGDCRDALTEYGLDRNRPTAHNWPIEFWTVGPLPWFQASLAWTEGPGGSRVMVTWLIPSAGGEPLSDLAHPADVATVDPPNPTTERRGSWIIGQERTRLLPSTGPEPLVYVSSGEIVRVAPNLMAGGVDPRREY